MNEPDDLALLREYTANDSETAFQELVSRRVDFVYSAALRQMRDPHLAEEITQAVFIILAQKAGRISDKTILTGWLFKTTRFAALAQIRAVSKRARHEKEFQMESEVQSTAPDELWNQMSLLLDEALAALGETDRQAVLLRFFENKSLAEVGNFLGIGEDTARKRISRALEKLHRYFNKRGVSSTTAIIAGAISTNSVQAAPMGLVKTISTVAIAKGAAASTSTLTLIKGALKIMAWTKAKIAILTGVGVLLATGTAATLVVQHIHNASRPIHVIKAKFVEIQNSPTDFLKSFPGIANATGILNADSAQTFFKKLQSKPGFKMLYEPELALTHGSVRTMSTTIITIVTNFAFAESNSVSSIFPQTGTVETGPVLNITSTATSNGLTKLTVNASITYFLGYGDTSKLSPRQTNNLAGERVDLPIVLPLVQTKKASTEATLEDGQTLVMILPESEQQAFSDTPPSGGVSEPVNDKKTSIIMLTPEFTNAGKNQ